MKTILSIGYHHYLLPAKANINSITASLAGMERLDKSYKAEGNTFRREGVEQIKFTIVEDSQIEDRFKKLPEKSSPDCHGQDITTPD